MVVLGPRHLVGAERTPVIGPLVGAERLLLGPHHLVSIERMAHFACLR